MIQSHFLKLARDAIQSADVAINSAPKILKESQNNGRIRERALKIVPENVLNAMDAPDLSIITREMKITHAEHIPMVIPIWLESAQICVGQRVLSQNQIHQRDWMYIFIMERVREGKYRSDPI